MNYQITKSKKFQEVDLQKFESEYFIGVNKE